MSRSNELGIPSIIACYDAIQFHQEVVLRPAKVNLASVQADENLRNSDDDMRAIRIMLTKGSFLLSCPGVLIDLVRIRSKLNTPPQLNGRSLGQQTRINLVRN